MSARVVALDGSFVRDETRTVAVERPVEVRIADVPFAVMMLTPADLVDFAYGFSLTEGVIDRTDEIRDVAITDMDEAIRLQITPAADRLRHHLARQRAMTGRTGCGICGIDDVAALRRADPSLNEPAQVTVAAIGRALAALETRQVMNAVTRAVHGAGWADLDGTVLEVREDVGRHNALDKLIGALMRRGTNPRGGFLLITSRCSFEMVEKAARFGAGTIVAISAPTSFAIDRANALNVCLIAIARRDTFTVFSAPDRIGIIK